jgi:hypothetical protein
MRYRLCKTLIGDVLLVCDEANVCWKLLLLVQVIAPCGWSYPAVLKFCDMVMHYLELVGALVARLLFGRCHRALWASSSGVSHSCWHLHPHVLGPLTADVFILVLPCDGRQRVNVPIWKSSWISSRPRKHLPLLGTLIARFEMSTCNCFIVLCFLIVHASGRQHLQFYAHK